MSQTVKKHSQLILALVQTQLLIYRIYNSLISVPWLQFVFGTLFTREFRTVHVAYIINWHWSETGWTLQFQQCF